MLCNKKLHMLYNKTRGNWHCTCVQRCRSCICTIAILESLDYFTVTVSCNQQFVGSRNMSPSMH